MAHLRILIADEDSHYIASLQQKFIIECFNKIDLEIITDTHYFRILFSYPQKIEVLIISEDLYSSEIQKHDIKNIIIMSEDIEVSNDISSNINRIYKYTNLKEIFNRIMSIVNNTIDSHLSDNINDNRRTKVVLVDSANGGVGKTTVALGISKCLANNYKKVLYVNASRLQYSSILLNNSGYIMSIDIYANINNSTNVYGLLKQVIENYGFNYLPPFRSSLLSLNIDFSIFEKIVKSAIESNEYDYIILDSDNVLDEFKIHLIDISTKVIYVTNQEHVSANALNSLLSNINITDIDKYLVICNDFDNTIENYHILNNSRYTVSEYIKHFIDYNNLTIEQLALDNQIQKVSFLVM